MILDLEKVIIKLQLLIFLLSLPIAKFSNVIQLQLSEIELPLTFYAISKSLKNNYFWIRMVVNDLNRHFFLIWIFWKIGKYESSSWQEVQILLMH